jgi:deoxyribonuclease V
MSRKDPSDSTESDHAVDGYARRHYNQAMPVQQIHPWDVTTSEARAIQLRLAGLVSRKNEVSRPRLVAGVDISAPRFQGKVRGTVVVLSYPELEVVEIGAVEQTVDFPYIPGLLSFRESPVILAAYEKLKLKPDLTLVDGQGIAHPRRFGIASHLGVLLDVPTIGCAKSLLCGAHDSLGAEVGSAAEIEHDGEVVGMALRTKANVQPVYVSIGHKVDLTAAVSWVSNCCRGYRLPEPTRLAHFAASGNVPKVKRPALRSGRL